MNDLLDAPFLVPISIVIAEMLATIYLSRRKIERRLVWIIGIYLLFVVLAVLLGLIGHDEFGFSWIPLLVITEPWTIVIEKLGVNVGLLHSESFVGMILGIAFNCMIFHVIDRVSYPKYATEPQANT